MGPGRGVYAAVGATMPEASRKAADGLEPVSNSPCASLTSELQGRVDRKSVV